MESLEEVFLKMPLTARLTFSLCRGTNPAYRQVNGEFDKALSKIKNLIVITSELNETAVKAQFVLGESHFLEAWGDSEIRLGVVSIYRSP